MKHFLSILAIFQIMLSSCVTTTNIKPTKPNVISNGLTPQTLAEGECGLFLWTTSQRREFVFFQKSRQNYALFFSDNEQNVLQAKDLAPDWNIIESVDAMYLLGSDSIRVKGSFSQELEGGRRIKQASIVITKQNGWQEIIPVLGVYGCSQTTGFKPN